MTKLKSILTPSCKRILVGLIGTGLIGFSSLLQAETGQQQQPITEDQFRAIQAQMQRQLEEQAMQNLQNLTPEKEAALLKVFAQMVALDMKAMADQLALNEQEKKDFLANFTEAMSSEEPVQVDPKTEMTLSLYFQKRAQEQQQRAFQEQLGILEEHKKPYAEFWKGLDDRKEIVTTQSGLKYEVLQAGSGETPTADNQVVLHYTGTLPDGTVFDSSRERAPFTVDMAQPRVIAGFAEGISLGQKGSKLRLYIPAELGYGFNTPGPIPLGAPLIFDIEVLDIQSK